MPKVRDKERILKEARKKEVNYIQRSSHQLISLKKLCRLEGIGKKYSKLWKAGTYSQKIIEKKLSLFHLRILNWQQILGSSWIHKMSEVLNAFYEPNWYYSSQCRIIRPFFPLFFFFLLLEWAFKTNCRYQRPIITGLIVMILYWDIL